MNCTLRDSPLSTGCRARGFSWPPHRPLTALCPFRGSMTPLCSAQPPQSEAGRLIQQVELDRYVTWAVCGDWMMHVNMCSSG